MRKRILSSYPAGSPWYTSVASRFPDVERHVEEREFLSLRSEADTTDQDVPHAFTPDRHRVIYLASESTDKIMKVSIDGGAPVELAHGNVFGPAISPDGHSVAYYRLDEEGANRRRKFVIQSIEGGAPVKEIDAPRSADNPLDAQASLGLLFVSFGDSALHAANNRRPARALASFCSGASSCALVFLNGTKNAINSAATANRCGHVPPSAETPIDR